ncbi:hypothetical protein AHiyo4_34340 [Arthrobacter sp. Hiyo4]|nr:hypothetical protein AHiyo4_34340 [Arthrobacter sp. Hiyo4]
MRTFVSAIAVVVGVLLSALAVPAIWLDRNVVQEDGFVALAAPLGQDAEFQQRLAAAAVGTIDTGVIPDALAGLVTPVLEAAAGSLTALPGYPAAWEETLRKSHRLSFAAPASVPAEPDSRSSLTLDVAPLVALATEELARTTGLPLTAPEQTLVNVGEPEQRQMVERVSAYAPLGYSLAIGAGIAFALALVSAAAAGRSCSLWDLRRWRWLACGPPAHSSPRMQWRRWRAATDLRTCSRTRLWRPLPAASSPGSVVPR